MTKKMAKKWHTKSSKKYKKNDQKKANFCGKKGQLTSTKGIIPGGGHCRIQVVCHIIIEII